MPQEKKRDLESLKKKLNEAKERIVDLERNFEHKVQENPVQSVAIAFGAGLISGALLYALIRSKR